ncbi:MAG: hypothetical protein EOO23_01750 [Comamonadaceae bacterium]|nr:MAG: hypothetical protein EOO23_01750 [Comamonadaceae bacterium]
MMPKIKTFDELARALKRFEELFGAAEGSAEASELREVSNCLRAFEDQIAAKIAARRMFAKTLVDRMTSRCPRRANLP